MSFDLAFWYQSFSPTAESAARVYSQLTEGHVREVEESPAIEAFCQDVYSIYPDMTERNMHDSPWASPLYVTGGCVIAAVSWSRSDEVCPVLLELASRHGLVAYNPQTREVYD
ncbi:hypothetical protein N0X72_08900 [Streptomyces carpaticus]|uniref:hypothetical protein n=1 Tax=Streptomyces carpaticus TaxID=285558 RepID=UPI00220E8141|nr:hypothetical protein N0X72_08900 [Streptomyces carpaticus]